MMENVGPVMLTIRSVMPSDYELCMALDHTVSTETVWQMMLEDSDGALQATFRTARLPRSMKVLYPRAGETLLNSWRLHAGFLIAEWEHIVVGYVNIHEQTAQETAWIADLAVNSSHRLRGIGTALLDGARRWAVEHGLRRLIAETQTKNYPAIKFLNKRGLTFCGYNDLYYPNQDIAVFFGQTLR